MGVKQPALLIGGVILAAALGTAGAWVIWPRQTSSPRTANATQAKPAPAPIAIPAKPETKSAAPIVVPEAAAPPEPTSAEFARATAAPETPAPSATEPAASIDWTALPIDELRTRANADELPAMEEMARRRGAAAARRPAWLGAVGLQCRRDVRTRLRRRARFDARRRMVPQGFR